MGLFDLFNQKPALSAVAADPSPATTDAAAAGAASTSQGGLLTKNTEGASVSDGADPADPILSLLPKPTSLFEFGPTVSVGENIMYGLCTSDNPDAIQACTWSIEAAQGKPKEKKHMFKIGF